MCVKCFTNNLSSKYLQDLPAVFRQAMLQLYNNQITPEALSPELIQLLARELWSGVEIGIATEVTEESQIYKLISGYKENVFYFSGFKTYHQLRETSLLLFNEAGELKSFTAFLKEVQNINKLYNINYLRAEYDHAVVSGQMAEKWVEFEPEAMLKFKATIDDHTTEICHSLNGLTKPKSWPGWKKYWLPLHWGERSNIIKTTDDETDEVLSDLENPQDMFNGNVAIDGVIFPDTHPYYEVNANTKKSIVDRLQEIRKDIQI